MSPVWLLILFRILDSSVLAIWRFRLLGLHILLLTVHLLVWCCLLCLSILLARISCVFWHLGLSWVSLSFLGFSLQCRWCSAHRVLHQARPCRRLFGHLGRLCMRCVLYLLFLGLFVWGLLGDRLWSTHFFRPPSDCDLFFHSLVDDSFVDFPYIVGQCDASFVRAFPFLAFPFVESCDFTSLGGCIHLCGYSQSWFLGVASSPCLLQWRFRLGFYQVPCFCFFLVSLLFYPFLCHWFCFRCYY